MHPRVYIHRRQGGPVMPPGTGQPILVASYDTHGLRWDYSYSPVTTRGGKEMVVAYSTLLSRRSLRNVEENDEDRGSMFFRNADICLQILQPGRRISTSSQL
jgi:hypothetical protein